MRHLGTVFIVIYFIVRLSDTRRTELTRLMFLLCNLHHLVLATSTIYPFYAAFTCPGLIKLYHVNLRLRPHRAHRCGSGCA